MKQSSEQKRKLATALKLSVTTIHRKTECALSRIRAKNCSYLLRHVCVRVRGADKAANLHTRRAFNALYGA